MKTRFVALLALGWAFAAFGQAPILRQDFTTNTATGFDIGAFSNLWIGDTSGQQIRLNPFTTGSPGTAGIFIQDSSGSIMTLRPLITTASTTPYLLDTGIAHTSGNILEVENLDTNLVTIDHDGGLTLSRKTNIIADSGLTLTYNGNPIGGAAGVTNYFETTIVTNLFFISGKGNTLIITNDMNLLANPSALLMTTAASLVTNVGTFSGITFTPGTRTLAVGGTLGYTADNSISDLSFREARVTFSAAASFDTGLGLSVSAASSPTAAGNALCIPYRNLVTTTTLNNDAFANGEGMFNPLNMRHWSFIVHISSLTSNRVWCGVANTTWGNMLPSDAPAFDLAAIRYSPTPGVGDVNWMFCTSDATTQQSESTGIPATTNQTIFTFTVDAAATTWTCYINGVPVRTNTTNVPRTSVSTMRWGFGTRTLESTVAKTVSMATIASRARVPGL